MTALSTYELVPGRAESNLEETGMEGFGWIMTIIIGGLAGWIAEKVMSADHGLLTNIVLGILGAVILNALLVGLFGSTLGGFIGQLVVAAIGACLLIFGYRAIRGRG
ncbi:GlsB/YeaQ/YmgE family stress response membrane protein [Rhodopseudomonas julia]